jgi:magnesium chelatase family protein
MLAKALSSAVIGLESALVEVEVDLSPGLPSFQIVGLPDTAVQESAGTGSRCYQELRGALPE